MKEKINIIKRPSVGKITIIIEFGAAVCSKDKGV